MKLFKFAILMVWLVACGGEYMEEQELGQTEMGFSARNSHGIANGSTPNEGAQCNAASDCLFPADKVVSFRCGSGFTAAEKTQCETFVDEEVQNLIGQFSPGWQFGRVAAGGDVIINKGNTGTTAGLLDIRPYVSVFPSGCGAALAESPVISGSYKKCTGVNVAVDWADIDANFASASDRIRVKAHTIGMASAAGVGLGYTSGSTDRKNSTRITTGATKQLNFSAADRCRVTFYDPTGSTATTIPGC